MRVPFPASRFTVPVSPWSATRRPRTSVYQPACFLISAQRIVVQTELSFSMGSSRVNGLRVRPAQGRRKRLALEPRLGERGSAEPGQRAFSILDKVSEVTLFDFSSRWAERSGDDRRALHRSRF